MTHKITYAFALLAVLTLIYFAGSTLTAKASAPSGLMATVATTSNPTVGTTQLLIVATSSCAARVITTVASPIMLTFSDAQGKVPSALFGILQPASTTVAYDSGQFGCGAVRAYSFVSSAITVMESN